MDNTCVVGLSDIATLPNPTEDSIVKALTKRVSQQNYFTLVGPVLLSIQQIIDNAAELKTYQEQIMGDDSTLIDRAHLFLYLMRIFHQLCQHRSSHSILLCGLSASGKSTVLRTAIQFLSAAEPEYSSTLDKCLTLLNACGTMQTPQNPNTSKSALHVKMFFDEKGRYSAAEFNLCTLELSRITRPLQNKNENNFQIFYLLVYGETLQNLEKWKLSPLREYSFMPLSRNTSVDYSKELKEFKSAFLSIFNDPSGLEWIFKMVAVILHLGNIKFSQRKAPKKKETPVMITNRDDFNIIVHLLVLSSPEDFEDFFLSQSTAKDAENARDQLAMLCYLYLTSWLIGRINNVSKNGVDTHGIPYIGLIDICGICENQEKLDLEGFMINYTNEKIREVFYKSLFENSPVEFQDNEGCILFNENICNLLEREFDTPSDNAGAFVDNFRTISELTNSGTLLSDGELQIDHYIGPVSYNLSSWYSDVKKYSQTSIKNLQNLTSSSKLFARSFPYVESSKVFDKISGIYYISNVSALVNSLKATKNHFIYCLRRGTDNSENQLSSCLIPQLQAYGIVELAEISQYTKNDLESLEYCNSFPGGSRKKKNKKKKGMLSAKKRFTDLRFNKNSASLKSSEDLLSPKQLNNNNDGDNIETTSSGALKIASPRRRSKSIKHRIRPKSRNFKGEDSKLLPQVNAIKKQERKNALGPQSVSYTSKEMVVDFKDSFPIKRSNSEVSLDTIASDQSSNYDSDSSEDGSLILSEDELSDISCSDNEIEDLNEDEMLRFPPGKEALINRNLFTKRLNSIEEFNDDKILDRVECFCWPTDTKMLRINDVEVLRTLTKEKLAIDLRKIESTDELTTEEIESRKEKFLSMYKCGSLLRTLHQRESSSQEIFGEPGNLTRSSSEGSFSNVSKGDKVPIRSRSSNMRSGVQRAKNVDSIISPRFPDDESDDELVGIEDGDDKADSEQETVNWNIPHTFPRKSSIHLSLDTVDDVVNQINYSNTIKASPRRRKNIIDFNNTSQSFSFSTYAESHFNLPKKFQKLKPGSSKYKTKLKKLISATREPIDSALLTTRSPVLNELAIENFKHVLAYMIAKDSCDYNPLSHASVILRNGLEKSSLRDEIYSQLVKQATNNLKERFLIRIWHLIAFCTGCFSPSTYFHKYLIKFLETTANEPGEIGAWASYSKDRILKISELGKRFFTPTEKELNVVLQRKPLIQIFYFLDGKQKQIPVYSSTTATEALEFLLQMVGLKDNQGYMVYEQFVVKNKKNKKVDTIERSLLYSEVLCNSMSKFEELKACYSKEDCDVETSFIIKRKLFLTPRKMPNDPVEKQLLYHQARKNILYGQLLVTEQDALILCALEMQEQSGDFDSSRKYHAKELLPNNIRHHRPEKEWKRELNELHSALTGVTKSEAKDMFLQYCTQLPFYGFHLFPVRHHSHWRMPPDVYIAIHITGLFFLSANKEVYYCFSFPEVLTHIATPFTLQIGFDNDQCIEVRTNKGDEIISLIIDYKYYEFTKDDIKN